MSFWVEDKKKENRNNNKKQNQKPNSEDWREQLRNFAATLEETSDNKKVTGVQKETFNRETPTDEELAPQVRKKSANQQTYIQTPRPNRGVKRSQVPSSKVQKEYRAEIDTEKALGVGVHEPRHRQIKTENQHVEIPKKEIPDPIPPAREAGQPKAYPEPAKPKRPNDERYYIDQNQKLYEAFEKNPDNGTSAIYLIPDGDKYRFINDRDLFEIFRTNYPDLLAKKTYSEWKQSEGLQQRLRRMDNFPYPNYLPGVKYRSVATGKEYSDSEIYESMLRRVRNGYIDMPEGANPQEQVKGYISDLIEDGELINPKLKNTYLEAGGK